MRYVFMRDTFALNGRAAVLGRDGAATKDRRVHIVPHENVSHPLAVYCLAWHALQIKLCPGARGTESTHSMRRKNLSDGNSLPFAISFMRERFT